ncbi:hypothetical protein [Nostoc sp.]|uniref:hypothetical protein n=1 Tax=Nostoc sp. TaxID=1180 RepID=UPI002FF8FD4B
MTNSLVAEIQVQLKKAPTQLKVFNMLSDKKWHCRDHEGKPIASAQYAGGGGIQGLERGNRSGRRGLVIEAESKNCQVCDRRTRHDVGQVK